MSHTFRKIVCIDKTNLLPKTYNKLQEISSSETEIYNDTPEDESEIIRRIGKADCVFVSWRTKITANVIRQCPELKYIGMCCSLIDRKSSNVDISEAEKYGIEVRGVNDYADEGVIEFIFAQLINLAQGLNQQQWKDQPTELKDKRLGIIGFGNLGQKLAVPALAFGMEVSYFSRTRKKEIESCGIKYLPLDELLSRSDIISLHLPRDTRILGEKEFNLMKSNTILVNTSIGPVYDINAFEKWISHKDNFAITDKDGALGYNDLYAKFENVINSKKAAGLSDKMYTRLSEKVLQNALDFLENS